MNFKAYFLKFKSPLHIGEMGVGVEKVSEIIHSDTLWSALINAWIKLTGSDEILKKFIENKESCPFLLSSAFPFVDNTLFLPKPLYIKRKEDEEDILSKKVIKKWKKSNFIPFEIFIKILKGENITGEELKFNSEKQEILKENIVSSVNPRVQIGPYSEEESILYFIGETFFSNNSGLYFLVKFNENIKDEFEKVLEFLGEERIGGKRSYGHGIFYIYDVREINFPEVDSNYYITLSLLNDTNIIPFLKDSFYSLILRKGWSLSPITKTQTPWKPLYMFSEGSIFPYKPIGRIVEVTPDEWRIKNHSIYRNGLGFYLKIKL